MSKIIAAYTAEPNFPATDQHPQAIRQQIGPRWFDVLDGPITSADVKVYDDEVATESRTSEDDKIVRISTVRIALDHENRIRALEGKPPLTAAQFATEAESK